MGTVDASQRMSIPIGLRVTRELIPILAESRPNDREETKDS